MIHKSVSKQAQELVMFLGDFGITSVYTDKQEKFCEVFFRICLNMDLSEIESIYRLKTALTLPNIKEIMDGDWSEPALFDMCQNLADKIQAFYNFNH